MREIVLIEWTGPGDVCVLARTDDPDLVARLSVEIARLERRRLARLEGPRLVAAPEDEED